MKAKLLTVLNQCIYNKSLADYQAIIELINTINDDKTSDIKLSQSNIGLYVSMYNEGMLFSIMYTDNNTLLFSMPDNISKTHVIGNSPIGQHDSYNIQYDDIAKELGI